jgi:hypothetical protein
LVDARDFGSIAAALPDLLSPLEPLAQQWDRLSDEQCWMLILPGPAKVDLIFPDVPHVHEPPWEPGPDNLAALDAHFWDWMLWLQPKAARGKQDLVAAELSKLFDHLLGPLGVEREPSSIVEAIASYRRSRDLCEHHWSSVVSRELEAEALSGLHMLDG